MIFEIMDLDLKLNTWADLVSKLQCDLFLGNMALRTNRMQIMNISIENDDLDPKLEICEIWSQN